MESWQLWFEQNWFSLVQSVGVIGSLWLATATLKRDAKTRRTSDLLTLTSLHRELWSEIYRNPQLSRVLKTKVDLVEDPVSLQEKEFLHSVIVHFYLGWLLVTQNHVIPAEVYATDVRAFFSLPLPNAVWNLTKARDSDFVSYVEKTLSS
jgi:hypothetical protein